MPLEASALSMTMAAMTRGTKFGDIITFRKKPLGWMHAVRLNGALYVDELDNEQPTNEQPFQSPPNVQDCLFRIQPQHRYVALKAYNKRGSEDNHELLQREARDEVFLTFPLPLFLVRALFWFCEEG